MHLLRLVYRISPAPKTQTAVWQIYAHVDKTLSTISTKDKINVTLRDFKVPRKVYYNRGNYIDQLQLSLLTSSEQDVSVLRNSLAEELHTNDVFKFDLSSMELDPQKEEKMNPNTTI